MSSERKELYESNQPQSHYGISTGQQPQMAPTNRLSEQEEEEEEDADYDDDIEEGCEEDLSDNVSKNTTSSTFTCYSGLGDSKLKAYSCASVASTIYGDSLRKRNIATSANNQTCKSKCVQFMPPHNMNENSSHSTVHSSAESKVYSKHLKKIIFNGTFPIDDPYSSRF